MRNGTPDARERTCLRAIPGYGTMALTKTVGNSKNDRTITNEATVNTKYDTKHLNEKRSRWTKTVTNVVLQYVPRSLSEEKEDSRWTVRLEREMTRRSLLNTKEVLCSGVAVAGSESSRVEDPTGIGVPVAFSSRGGIAPVPYPFPTVGTDGGRERGTCARGRVVNPS